MEAVRAMTTEESAEYEAAVLARRTPDHLVGKHSEFDAPLLPNAAWRQPVPLYSPIPFRFMSPEPTQEERVRSAEEAKKAALDVERRFLKATRRYEANPAPVVGKQILEVKENPARQPEAFKEMASKANLSSVQPKSAGVVAEKTASKPKGEQKKPVAESTAKAPKKKTKAKKRSESKEKTETPVQSKGVSPAGSQKGTPAGTPRPSPGTKQPDKPRGKGGGRKEQSERPTPAEKSESDATALSEANLTKTTHLRLDVKLKPKPFLALAGVAGSLGLVNGVKEGNPHADDNALRHVLTWTLIGHLRASGLTVKDYQGKARGPCLKVGGVDVEYPHICRSVKTARDVGFESPCGGLEVCSVAASTLMCVDVITHMSKQEVIEVLLRSGNREMWCVFHDLYRTNTQPKYRLCIQAGKPVWIRSIDGNNDSQPDLYQEWIALGGFYETVGGVRYAVVAREWGPQFGTQRIMKLTLLAAGAPAGSFEAVRIDGKFWNWAATGLRQGVYRFDQEVPRRKVIVVTPDYVVMRGLEECHYTICPRATVEATLKSMALKPTTTGSDSTARRKVAAQVETPDVQTFKEVIEATVEVVDMSTEQAKARATLWNWMFPPKTIDERARLNERFYPTVDTTTTSRGSLLDVLPPLKSWAALFTSLPKLIGAVPFLLLVLTYLRRRAARAVSLRAPESLLTRIAKAPSRVIASIWRKIQFAATVRLATGQPALPTLSWRSVLTSLLTGTMSLVDNRSQMCVAVYATMCGLVPLVEETQKSLVDFATAVGIDGGFANVGKVMDGMPHVGSYSFAAGELIWTSAGELLTGRTPLEVACRRLPPFGMHCAMAPLSWAERVCIHSAWNALCVYMSGAAEQPASLQLKCDGSTRPGPLSDDGMPGYVSKTDALPDLCKIEGKEEALAKLRIKTWPEGVPLTVEQLTGFDGNAEKSCVFPNTIIFNPVIPRMQADVPTNMAVALRTRVLHERDLYPQIGFCGEMRRALDGMIDYRAVIWKDFGEWNSRYSGAVQAQNERELREILEHGTDDVVYVCMLFLKKELNHSFDFIGKLKDPRNISPPGDQRVKVIQGPFFYSLSQCLNKQWDGEHSTFPFGAGFSVVVLVNSGLDPNFAAESQAQRFARCASRAYSDLAGRRGAFIAVAGDDNWMLVSNGILCVLICADGNRWDAGIREPVLDVEQHVYREFAAQSHFTGTVYQGKEYGGPDEVFRLVDESTAGRFKCQFYEDVGVTFEGVMPDMRHSGDQYTTFGNNVDNAGASAVIASRVERVLNIGPPDMLGAVKAVVEEGWKQMGIKSDVQVHWDPLRGDFCSSLLVPVRGHWWCIPLPGKFLARFGLSVSSPRTIEQVRAIVHQFSVYINVPFIGPVIGRVSSLVGAGEEDLPDDYKYNMHYKASEMVPPPCEDTWEWFQHRYGLGQAEHGMVESSMAAITALPWLVEIPAITALFDVDLALDRAASSAMSVGLVSPQALYKWIDVATETVAACFQSLRKLSRCQLSTESFVLVDAELAMPPTKRSKQPKRRPPQDLPPQRNKQNKPQKMGNQGGIGMTHKQRGPGSMAKGDQSTVLQHAVPELDDILEKDEFVTDIVGSNGTGNVVVTKYAFNPGQASLFPLGAAEANKWTNWKCISAIPYVLHEVSEFATDGSTGKVYLAMDYNAANDAPTTKQQLADMHSASAMPCEDFSLKLIPRLLNRADPKYIRNGPKPAGADIRLYDGGNLYVAAIGQSGTTKLGELRIRYKFKLELPTLLNPTGLLSDDATVAQFQSPNAGEVDAAGSAAPYQMLLATAVANGLGAVNTAGSIVPPAGNYKVDARVQCIFGSSANTVFQVYIYKNGAVLNPDAYTSMAYATATFTTLTLNVSTVVQCNGTDNISIQAVPTYSGGGNPTMVGACMLQVV
jgi:hypothetical protein